MPTSDLELVMRLLREMSRARYRDARLEELRLETIAYCAAEVAARQRRKWGLDEGTGEQSESGTGTEHPLS